MMHEKMSKIFILLMISISFMATPVGAHASAAEVLLLLNDLCVNTDADLSSVEKIAIEKGGVNIKPKELESDGTEPSTFSFRYGKNKYFVQVYEKDTCSVIALADAVDPKQVSDIMQRNYPLSKPEIEYSDVSVITEWKIAYQPHGRMTYPPPIGAILLRVVVKKERKSEGTSLIFVTPKSLYEKEY
ncbi:hypothetical protein [Verminephrobacter aporrectodeae]|uniref:hypothetical protein n=1 Tax=Verminephrobacter aporrectodeae TaxID=1110389 RepID=UPI0022371B4E|nr:hypothetical protein [Verminephrobacter aporrectodeae]